MIDLSLDGSLFITSEFDEALQELDILFETSPTELLGNTTYGTNFEQFLWSLTPNVSSLYQYITNKITSETYYVKKFLHSVNVDYAEDINENIYRVSITIYKNSDDDGYTKTYIIK